MATCNMNIEKIDHALDHSLVRYGGGWSVMNSLFNKNGAHS